MPGPWPRPGPKSARSPSEFAYFGANCAGAGVAVEVYVFKFAENLFETLFQGQGSAPAGGATTLTDAKLFDGSLGKKIKVPNLPPKATSRKAPA